MSKGETRLCRWTALLLVFVFTFVSSGMLMLTPQPAEAAVTSFDEAQAIKKRIGTTLYNSMAIRVNGSVEVWGGSSSSATRQVPTEAQSEVVAIAGGNYHILALKANGTIVAWGYNDYGQIDIPEELNNIVAIAAGHDHSLALKADGTIVAWGRNDYGQIDIPEELNNNVIAIASGPTSFHSLAIKANGTVIGWGWNGSGQCNPPPMGLFNNIAVATGYKHSIALKRGGSVITWGEGVGVTSAPRNLNNVVDIAAIEAGCAVLYADGTIRSWEYYHMVGGAKIKPDPQDKLRALIGGSNHYVGVTDEAKIVAWGADNRGACAVPNPVSRTTTLTGLLSNLTIDKGTLTPAFHRNILDYTVEFSDYVAGGLNVTATLEEPEHQFLYCNGQRWTSGQSFWFTDQISLEIVTQSADYIGRTINIKRNNVPRISNVKITDINGNELIKSVFGAEIPIKISFDVNTNLTTVTQPSFDFDLPTDCFSLKLVKLDGLYKSDDTVVSTNPNNFIISENRISIKELALEPATYELRFSLTHNFKKQVKAKIYIYNDRLINSLCEFLEIEYVDLPGIL